MRERVWRFVEICCTMSEGRRGLLLTELHPEGKDIFIGNNRLLSGRLQSESRALFFLVKYSRCILRVTNHDICLNFYGGNGFWERSLTNFFSD